VISFPCFWMFRVLFSNRNHFHCPLSSHFFSFPFLDATVLVGMEKEWEMTMENHSSALFPSLSNAIPPPLKAPAPKRAARDLACICFGHEHFFQPNKVSAMSDHFTGVPGASASRAIPFE